MQKPAFRIFLVRTVAVVIVVLLLELIGYATMYFNSRSYDFLSNKNYFNIRCMLMGCTDEDMLPRYLTVPYLGYIPYPGYKYKGLVQHNADGYRGDKVPLSKGEKYRVLCLGGSTTYGTGVVNPAEAYPAQLEVLLNQFIITDTVLARRYDGAEVLNAGLEAGTSAEELQQYLLKYRYYKPDAVVVHSGINDALIWASATTDFQPDYTHYRRINFHLEPLPQPARWLMKSYLFSFLTIRFYYSNFSVVRDEFTHQTNKTYPAWASLNTDSVVKQKAFEWYPFYQNSNNLLRQITADSISVFVLPGVLNVKSDFVRDSEGYRSITALNDSLSKLLAEQNGVYFIPFAYDSISRGDYWVDDCHLNAAGEKEKAQLVLNYLTANMKR